MHFDEPIENRNPYYRQGINELMLLISHNVISRFKLLFILPLHCSLSYETFSFFFVVLISARVDAILRLNTFCRT